MSTPGWLWCKYVMCLNYTSLYLYSLIVCYVLESYTSKEKIIWYVLLLKYVLCFTCLYVLIRPSYGSLKNQTKSLLRKRIPVLMRFSLFPPQDWDAPLFMSILIIARLKEVLLSFKARDVFVLFELWRKSCYSLGDMHPKVFLPLLLLWLIVFVEHVLLVSWFCFWVAMAPIHNLSWL